jgi:hypothetical protein
MKIKVFIILTLLSALACKPNRESGGTNNSADEKISWAIPPISAALANQCFGPFKVSVSGNASNDSINLDATSYNLSYYSDENCDNTISSILVSPNQGSTSFYIKGTAIENPVINLSFGNSSISNQLLIGDISLLGYSLSPLSIPNGSVGACSGPISLGLKKNGQYVSAPADIDIELDTTGAVNFYSDSSCQNSVRNVTLHQKNSSTIVYFFSNDISGYALQGGSAIGSFSLNVSMVPGVATGIRIPNRIGHQGECVPVSVDFIDVQGNLTTTNHSVTFSINLDGTTSSSYPPGDSNCSGGTQSSSFTVPAGQTSYIFYIQDDTVETINVGLRGSDGTSADGSINIKCGGILGFFSSCHN